MWARIITTLLGLWLMVSPAVLAYGPPAATNVRIVGPLAASFAIIAVSEVTRPVRWANLALGLWLLVAPWVLGYDDVTASVNSFVVGTIMTFMAGVRGSTHATFGGGWSALWRKDGSNEERSMDAS